MSFGHKTMNKVLRLDDFKIRKENKSNKTEQKEDKFESKYIKAWDKMTSEEKRELMKLLEDGD